MIIKKYFLLLVLFSSQASFAQREDNRYSQDLKWRNIGPANMMGRIAAVDALNSDYRHVVVASASGGVFKSTNAGLSWEAIFERYGSGSIGSVSLFQANPEIIWVGTGESANRNSSGWGDGIYRSDDGGKTFQHRGLRETQHIAEIALHPSNPDIAFAAAVGHLWGYSGTRGLFRTQNGGETWEKLTGGLPTDEKTGCTEVIIHPKDPNTIFAGFYHRLRKPYWYTSGGREGGIFKSTDGGNSWKKLTRGLPTGETGMIDISICVSQPDIMVAAVEADENLPEGVPGSGAYISEDGGESWTFLFKHTTRPFYHGQIEIDPLNPDNIYMVSRDFQISTDRGKSFNPRDWPTDGGDDHDMWIAPYDNKIMYLCTDQGLRLSVDGGKTHLSLNNMAIGQYYAIDVDMRDPYYVIGGLQDNSIWIGPSNSREFRGILNKHNLWLGEGDGFNSRVDPNDWRTAYIVNHVGFMARVNVETHEHDYVTPNPQNVKNLSDYFDPSYEESMIDYTIDPGEYWFFWEFQDKPLLPPQFRFNWSSPMIISPQDSKTILFAGNHVFRSTNMGNNWEIISPDLTKNDPETRNPTKSGYLTRSVTGGENFHTMVSLAESPIEKGIIWAGSDDGLIHISRDAGNTWKEVGKNIFKEENKIYVSRIEPSKHVKGRFYVTLDNHRQDDMKPYLFVTEDYGESWTKISRGLNPDYSLYVVREDYVEPNLLFVGSEEGVSFSFDRGIHWYELMAGFPTVAVRDLVIHPRDGDLIAGTHGRSAWILDDITPLRALARLGKDPKDVRWLPSRQATDWHFFYEGRTQPAFEFQGENPDYGIPIHFFIGIEDVDSVKITVQDTESSREVSWKNVSSSGLNRGFWNLSFPISIDSLENYKKELGSILKDLNKRAVLTVQKDSIRVLKKEFSKVPIKRKDLNKFRKRVVRTFAGFAGGTKYFPDKLFPIHARPGTYNVSVQFGEKASGGEVLLRKDPTLD